ncbi:hypothetical protein D3C71_1919320 [compost metagenome]
MARWRRLHAVVQVGQRVRIHLLQRLAPQPALALHARQRQEVQAIPGPGIDDHGLAVMPAVKLLEVLGQRDAERGGDALQRCIGSARLQIGGDFG